jgi:hypothetical protein
MSKCCNICDLSYEMVYWEEGYRPIEKKDGQKIWVKPTELADIINLDNMPIEDMNEVYFPVVDENVVEDENGLEEKFGGDIPFFIKGEKWPMVEEVPMTFLCQIKDPREKNTNFLYRIFSDIDSPGFDEEYWITKIELNEENLKNQIFIDKPNCDLSITRSNEITTIDAYLIQSWKKDYELKDIDYYREKFNIFELHYSSDSFSVYYNSKKAPSRDIKIGGTPTSTDRYCNNSEAQEYNLLQITFCKWIPCLWWGETEMIHISNDCEFICD